MNLTNVMRRTGVALALAVSLAAGATLRADPQAEFRQIISAADLKGTEVGLLVMDLTTGTELARIDADEPRMPASNMKLVTTAAALKVLGPEFSFRTELRVVEPAQWKLVDRQPATNTTSSTATAPDTAAAVKASPAATPANDRVLVIRADGDPGFGDPELLKMHHMDVEQLLGVWVDAVKNARIPSIERIIVDDRVFDREFVHPSWPEEQLNSWFCAQVAGLNFYDNCVDVLPEPTSPGEPPRIRIMPSVPFLPIANRAQTGTADTFWVSRKIGTNDLTFWGKIKTRRTQAISTTIHDPPMLFGRVLADRLTREGIKVGTVVRPEYEDRIPDGRAIHAIQTTLPLVLSRCNKDSQNLFAEALIKRMGRVTTGQPGSWENGAAAVRSVLRETLGPSAAAVSVADGSGLSRDNRVTARVLVGLLAAMHKDAKLGPVYRESLSIAGADGTLGRRFKDIKCQLYGKSGYINGVSTLSGYLIAPPDGDRGEHVIAFAFLFNEFKPPVYVHHVRDVQDKLVRALDRRLAPASPRVGQGG